MDFLKNWNEFLIFLQINEVVLGHVKLLSFFFSTKNNDKMIEVGISTPLMIILDLFINKCVKSFTFLFVRLKERQKQKSE